MKDLDDGRKIQVFDRFANRQGRAGNWFISPEVPIRVLQLPQLAVRAPSAIAVSGILQVNTSDLLKAARLIKPRSELVGKRLMVDKTVGTR